ncbi:MAG: methyltransferase domain-containing protein, partial [Deltaproteobacteria bacterium]
EKPKRVLDLGTGSGILALAAAKWGAERVLAIDCNELAVDTALRNVEMNRESARIGVRVGKAEDAIDERADLVCANLHFQVIESLLTKESLFEKRWIILSGLFVKDAREVERGLNQKAIQTVSKIEERNWATWVGFNPKIELQG